MGGGALDVLPVPTSTFSVPYTTRAQTHSLSLSLTSPLLTSPPSSKLLDSPEFPEGRACLAKAAPSRRWVALPPKAAHSSAPLSLAWPPPREWRVSWEYLSPVGKGVLGSRASPVPSSALIFPQTGCDPVRRWPMWASWARQ